jgi:hypothetical protein
LNDQASVANVRRVETHRAFCRREVCRRGGRFDAASNPASSVRQCTAPITALRAHLAEYGIIAVKRRAHVSALIALIEDDACDPLSMARQVLRLTARTIKGLSAQIRAIEVELMAWQRTNANCQRLATIPGVGVITATALAATVADAKVFRSSRQLALERPQPRIRSRAFAISASVSRDLIRVHAAVNFALQSSRSLPWPLLPPSDGSP